ASEVAEKYEQEVSAALARDGGWAWRDDDVVVDVGADGEADADASSDDGSDASPGGDEDADGGGDGDDIAPAPVAGGLFAIEDVALLDADGTPWGIVSSPATVRLRFRYRTLQPFSDGVVFVATLYRHDGLYLCGTTTLMDGMPAFAPGRAG